MENNKYIVIKELPDASVGTEVIWDDEIGAFVYSKKDIINQVTKNYLTFDAVTKNTDFFCKVDIYPDYYAWNYPILSRFEINNLIDQCFIDKVFSDGNGKFRISASRELNKFKEKLRELGKTKAEIMIKNKQYDKANIFNRITKRS